MRNNVNSLLGCKLKQLGVDHPINYRKLRRFALARVTVEDCIEKIPNRFELVLLSAHRARLISSGAPITVDRDNDKNPVVALREIGDSTISPGDLKEDLIHSLQKYVEVDEPEAETAPMLESQGSDDEGMVFDTMSEEDLLRGIEGLSPPDRRDD